MDRWVLRRPFEGATAARYREMRRAFAAIDERVLAAMAPDLGGARRVIDVGAGAGEVAARIGAIAVEPSGTLVPRGGVRARAEALPFGDGSVDVALCLSSLRHVADRAAALRELRRVVTKAVWVVEVDRHADRRRRAAHTRSMSVRSRLSFWLWVVKTCPPPEHFAMLARDAGWKTELRRDEEQPFFYMRLT